MRRARSNLRWKHTRVATDPAVIHFPVALTVTSVASDTVGALTGYGDLYVVGAWTLAFAATQLRDQRPAKHHASDNSRRGAGAYRLSRSANAGSTSALAAEPS